MRPHSASERRRQTKNRIAAGIFVCIALLVAAFVAFRWTLTSNRVELVQDSMCPVDGPLSYTIVLIDGTDEFTPVQRAYLVKYFNRLKALIPKYGLIAIYAPQQMSDADFLTPELKICNPGSAEGVSGLTANPDQIQLRYEEKYAEKIDSVLSTGLAAAPASTSPVMEMIQAVSIDALPVSSSAPKRLVIVSDMLQNAPWYSHYRDSLEFDAAKNRSEFDHLFTDLSGVEIEVLYVRRHGFEHLQTNRHGLFWAEYFSHMGGALVSITSIGG